MQHLCLDSLRQVTSPAFPRGPAPLLGASRLQLLELAHQRRIGLTPLGGLISMISWSGVSSSSYLPSLPPPPPSHPQQGKRSSFPSCPQAFVEAVFSARSPWALLCAKPRSFPFEVASPLSRRPSLRMSASLPPAPVPVAQCTRCSLCPANRTLLRSELLSCRWSQLRSDASCTGRGTSRILPPLTLNSACLLPKLMWCACGNTVTDTGVPCPQTPPPHLSPLGYSILPCHTTFLTGSLNLSGGRGEGGPCLPLATEHWLCPVPSPPPTQAGPQLFIVQVQTSGAQALPTSRTELSRPQLSKNRLRGVHTVVKQPCWASKR